MNARDVMELKARFKAGACTIQKMAGCYVDMEKGICTKFRKHFLDLPDEEFFKYLEIIKQIYSKKVDDNMLCLDIKDEEKTMGATRQSLEALVASGLKDDDMLNAFCIKITEAQPCAGKYLILIYHDIYDIPKVAKDGESLDESEEVYDYISVAICPVVAASQWLEYKEQTAVIKPSERHLMVTKPTIGFVFPAFDERSADTNKIMYYTANNKSPQHAFMENCIGCVPAMTSTEMKDALDRIVFEELESRKETDKIMLDVFSKIYILHQENEKGILEPVEFKDILVKSKVNSYVAERIAEQFKKTFSYKLPTYAQLDSKRDAKRKEQLDKQKMIMEVMAKAAYELEIAKGEETDTVRTMKNIVGQNR